VQERAGGHITMPSLVLLGFHPPPERPKTLKFFVFVTGSIARSANAPVFKLPRGRF